MTAPTPEQMRVLAVRMSQTTFDGGYMSLSYEEMTQHVSALASAADRLEAVTELLNGMFDNGAVSVRAIRFALTRHGVNALPRKSGHKAETL